jgi:hypothetical protein
MRSATSGKKEHQALANQRLLERFGVGKAMKPVASRAANDEAPEPEQMEGTLPKQNKPRLVTRRPYRRR